MNHHQHQIPTVDDLRVKLCYICREEERFDAEPDTPAKTWTHPCTCTLVAHEACLLKWIQTSQSTSSRAPNALRCPQCGTQYEIESDNPRMLRVLTVGNRALQRAGSTLVMVVLGAGAAAIGTGIYVVLTSYGAWAVQQFIGKELYDLTLTDDPSNWPWASFINLPLLPITLILSRFGISTATLSLIPMLILWPPASPAGNPPPNPRFWASFNSTVATSSNTTLALPARGTGLGSGIPAWPPSPLLFSVFVLPWTRTLYKRYFTRFSHWVLGSTPPAARQRRGVRRQRVEWAGVRIRINMQEGVADAGADDEGEDAEADEGAQPGINNGAAGGNAPAEGGADEQPQLQDPNIAAVADAEHIINVDASSLGRLIGGALLIPAISSVMGSALWQLSRRSGLLRSFLGIKPVFKGVSSVSSFLGRGGAGPWGHALGAKEWEGLGFVKQLGMTLRIVLGAFWGARTWVDVDPVWWRNSIGLGLFVVAKDCVHLMHLWLVKRELETRHVKNRNFAGVDIRELDLIPSSLLRR